MESETVQLGTWWIVGFTLVVFWSGSASAGSNATPEKVAVREITITADQLQFAPDTIEVTQGDTVRLTIRAVDATYGFAIADLNVRAVINPNQEPVSIEFVANIPGRFRFVCGSFCGSGHGDMNGILSVVPVVSPLTRRDSARVDETSVDVIESDFNVITLPTTLRLPHNTFAFRLTHRFSRPLDGGAGFDNLFEDFFGFDSPAFIGLELRYGIAPGTQVGVYRNNNKNIQFFGRYNLQRPVDNRGMGLDAFLSVEGADNFHDEYSPAIGAVLSQQFQDRASVYVEPIWVGNTNKRVLHPETGFTSEDEDTLVVGLGSRIRIFDTVYVVAEYVPRVSGFNNGNNHISFGFEKRVGGHLFQINFSNGLGATPMQIAQGGDNGNWFIGFNIARKFY